MPIRYGGQKNRQQGELPLIFQRLDSCGQVISPEESQAEQGQEGKNGNSNRVRKDLNTLFYESASISQSRRIRMASTETAEVDRGTAKASMAGSRLLTWPTRSRKEWGLFCSGVGFINAFAALGYLSAYCMVYRPS